MLKWALYYRKQDIDLTFYRGLLVDVQNTCVKSCKGTRINELIINNLNGKITC